MITVHKMNKLPNDYFVKTNDEWLISEEIGDYIQGDIINITESESKSYYYAVNELYDMFIEAGDFVIENDKFQELGIDERLVPMIKHTWEFDNHWHLYGRFDLAGGIDGKPIKLIEFNADTATSIPECAVVQWAHLIHNNLDENNQFNELYVNLVRQFERLIDLNPEKEPNILFTYMNSEEDRSNVDLIANAAIEAGFNVEFRHLPEIIFSDDDNDGGVWVKYSEDKYTRFDFWFKLIPWEYLVEEEPNLIDILTNITINEQCVI